MASDGRLWFNTKIDNSGVTKDLKELERQIKKSQESISKAENAKLPLVKNLEEANRKLTEARRNLASLKADMAAAQSVMLDPGASAEDRTRASADIPGLTRAVGAQEKEVASLQKQWESVKEKVDKYDRAILQANTDIERATAKTAELNAQLATPNQIKVAQAMEKADKSAQRFGKRLLEIGKSALIFNLVSSGLRSVVRYMGTVLKTNSEYTAQLAQLKGVLLTAFQPIYEFVLPGVIAVLRVLTAIVQVVANVLSFFSGKTAAQSAKNAKALNDEAKAIEGVSGASKEAKKQLMGFDEINKLDSQESGGGSGTGEIAPDFSWMDGVSEKLEEIAKYVLLIALGFALWKIGTMLPGQLGSIISMLGLLLVVLAAIGLTIYSITDAWVNGVDWTNLAGILLGVAAAAGALYMAFGSIAAGIALVVGGVAMIITAFHDMMENGMNLQNTLLLIAGTLAAGLGISLLVGSWIPMAIAAVLALLAAVVYFTGHGGELIDGLKTLCSGFVDFFTGVFTGDWEQAWNGIVNIGKGAVNMLIAVLNSLISLAVSGINALFDLLSFQIETPGGGSIGLSLPQFTAPQIPYLAQGAVLPANKPFLAMVGDQTNGTNVEAPLETIKQALAEVMAEIGGGDLQITFTGELAALGKVLAPVVTKAQRDNDRGRGK